MVDFLLNRVSILYDRIHAIWEHKIVAKYMGPAMVLIYLSSLILIELKLRGWLPGWISQWVGESHFRAVYIAFSLLLVFEVIDLIFGITQSISKAFGKQLEIFAIILIRESFKSFEKAGEPIVWASSQKIILMILSDSFGAVIIIFLLAAYYKILCRHPIAQQNERKANFIHIKKLISLVLLGVFIYFGIKSVCAYSCYGISQAFFPFFFTLLILCDILLVLTSLSYSSTFPVVFRNSGFAVATILLRIGLTAPVYYNSAIGIVAAVYAICITLAYNIFHQKIASCEQ